METATIILKIKSLINEYMHDMIQLVFSYSDIALQAFKYIAFIAVVIKIFKTFRDNPSDWLGYLSWVPLTILLFNYDALIIGLFDWSISIDGEISSAYIYEQSKHFFDDAEINHEENSMFDIGITMFTDLIKEVLFESAVNIALFLGVIISTLAYTYLKIKMFFKLMLLTLFGPLNISLSLLDDFRGNYVGWITKLIEVCTYIPLIYLVDFIGVDMLSKVFSPKVITSAGEMAETLTRQLIGVLFYWGIIILYFSIPSAVKYVITQGNTAIGTGKKLTAVAMMTARKLATGGI